jgi:hypothetical protein
MQNKKEVAKLRGDFDIERDIWQEEKGWYSKTWLPNAYSSHLQTVYAFLNIVFAWWQIKRLEKNSLG